MSGKHGDSLLEAWADALSKIETYNEALEFCEEFLSEGEVETLKVRWDLFCSTMRGHSIRKAAEISGVCKSTASRARKQLGREAKISALLFERCNPGETSKFRQ